VYLFDYSEVAVRPLRKNAKSDYSLRHVRLSVRLSIRLSAWNNSAPTGQIFYEIWIFETFPKICRGKLKK
jgi:hypothetical protein